MSFGKAQKRQRNIFKSRLKIYNVYTSIDEEEIYDYDDKPSISGKELKELFKQKYKWLE